MRSLYPESTQAGGQFPAENSRKWKFAWSKANSRGSRTKQTKTHSFPTGNYVTVVNPPNVSKTVVIYAMNEVRSWFPATRYIPHPQQSGNVVSVGSPGGHGEVGGHFNSNVWVQQLNMTQMIEYAERNGTAAFVFGGIDPLLMRLYNSPYSAYVALKGVDSIYDPAEGELREDEFGEWFTAWTDLTRWQRYSPEAYRAQANSTKPEHWNPGPLGAQGDDFFGHFPTNSLFFVDVLFFFRDPVNNPVKQPIRDHYARDLDWVELGIWSLYDGIEDDDIKSLYNRILNPRGGWRTNWSIFLPDPVVLPDPIDEIPE